jgi:hypothetical protein
MNQWEAAGGTPVAIYPNASMLPSNTLRFYVDFGVPAEGTYGTSDIRLLDERDHEVGQPFLTFSQDLWSADGRRLTVLVDPARIKRNLHREQKLAPALLEGRHYTLTVSGLERFAALSFVVTDPVLSPLDESVWKVVAPAAGSVDPLKIFFDRVMDVFLCEDQIVLIDPDGRLADGQFQAAPDGGSVQWLPDTAWRRGTYQVIFADRLEDVCGNRLGEALDHPVNSGAQPRYGELRFVAT